MSRVYDISEFDISIRHPRAEARRGGPGLGPYVAAGQLSGQLDVMGDAGRGIGNPSVHVISWLRLLFMRRDGYS